MVPAVESPQKSPQKVRKPTPRLDLLTKTKIRNLYLIQDLSHAEIAERSGITQKQVGAYLVRAGLPKIKRRYAERVASSHDARALELLDSTATSIADQCVEHTLSGLKRTGEALARNDENTAREFQSLTGGVKNLVQAARAILGRDDKNNQVSENNVNIFLVRGERVERDIKPAQVVDITATPATLTKAPG